MTVETKPEDILVERLKQGCTDAFESVYDTYKNYVYSLAWRVLQNSHDAEEVVQDVFLKVYKKAASFKGNASLKTWIYRISVNAALTRLKKKRTIAGRISNVVDLAVFRDKKSTAGDQARDFADELLRRLPEDQRMCLVLKEIEGFNYEEIAELTNIPAGTVKSRVSRAKQFLREVYEKGGGYV